LAYSHHAAIRSDALHLAQAIHPFWLAVVAIPPARSPGLRRTVLASTGAGIALLILSLGVLPAANHQIRLLTQRQSLAVLRVGADSVRMPPAAAAVLRPIEGAVERQLAPHDAIFLAPDLAGLYPALGRTAPTHRIYLLLPESPEVQRRIIEQLEERRVRVAVISAGSLDGLEEYTFPKTHPLVWDHLRTRFAPVRGNGLAPQLLLLVRREAGAERSPADVQ
jgi:hypothetical protein